MDLNLPTGVKADEEKDVIGGGRILDSAVYPGIIELAYLDASDKGSKRVTIHFLQNEQVTKFTTYISNQAGGFTYKKDGSDHPLPGYSQMDSFFKSVTGKGLAQQETEEKIVAIYDYNAKKELPTKVAVFTDTVKQQIAIGILHVSQEKERDSGEKLPNGKPKYVGTGEFREINEFSKYFDFDSGLTLTEKAAGETDPAFLVKWKEKFSGQVIVKKAKNPGVPGTTPTADATGAAEPLFE